MGLSNGIALFIMIATAATPHRAGVGDIQTSAQAAEVMGPFDSSPRLKLVGWLATVVMAAAVCAIFAT